MSKWLEGMGYTMYSEVSPPYASGTLIDLVGVKGEYIIAVELKMSLTKCLIIQANTHCLFAHETYVAVASKPRKASVERCQRKHINLGVIQMKDNIIYILHRPHIRRKPFARYNIRFIERLKKCTPGYSEAGKPTLAGTGPNKAVFELIKEYLQTHPLANWKELYREVPNHYSSYGSMQTSIRIRQGFTLKKHKAQLKLEI